MVSKTRTQLTCRNLYEKSASFPHETLVDYEPVMFSFRDYNVLPAEKHDNREERLMCRSEQGNRSREY